jgi:hypothetical protein
MYTQAELKAFIANPPDQIDVEFVVEMAKQLLQEKQLNSEIMPSCGLVCSLTELE